MKLTSLTNIGQSMEKRLNQLGIHNVEEFMAADPYDLYWQLEKEHPNLHLAVLASLVGAHTGTPWYFIYNEIKNEIRNSKPTNMKAACKNHRSHY